MSSSLALTALASGCFAAVIAVAVTRAIERFGGLIGGVLGTIPTTIVPTAVGLATKLSPEQLTQSLATVAVGMLVNAAFLTSWRFLPPKLPKEWGLSTRLAVMVGFSYCVWLTLAAIAVTFELRVLLPQGSTSSIVAFCLACYFLLIALGVLLCMKPLDAPAGKKSVPWSQLVGRGVLAGVAIACTIGLSAVDGVVAGMASTFPAIFSTTMISLWVAQGEACPVGAVGPMVLGSCSVPTYAFLYAGVYASRTGAGGSPLAADVLGPYGTALVVWILSISTTSVPITLFVRWRRDVSQRGHPVPETQQQQQAALSPEVLHTAGQGEQGGSGMAAKAAAEQEVDTRSLSLPVHHDEEQPPPTVGLSDVGHAQEWR